VTAIPDPAGGREKHHLNRLDRGIGEKGQECRRRLAAALRRTDHERQGNSSRRRNALLIPMTEFSMGLTGDMNDIMNAHNLAMVALTARMQHERNYDDEPLAETDTYAAAGYRPGPCRIQLDYGFLRAKFEKYYIGNGGRKDGVRCNRDSASPPVPN